MSEKILSGLFMFILATIAFVVTMFSIGCSSSQDLEVKIIGKNGHSIVSESLSASEIECETSGTRLDMYLDLDDSLSVTSSDQWLNSVVVCNGANGLNGINGKDGTQGPQGLAGAVGPQGEPGIPGPIGPTGATGPSGTGATISNYSSSGCSSVNGSSVFVKSTGNNNFGLYSSSNCASNTKTAEISEGESYWTASNQLAVWSSSGLRVITFN